MTDRQRHLFLGVLLLATLGLTAYTFISNKTDVEIVGAAKVSEAVSKTDINKQPVFLQSKPQTHREVEQRRIFYTAVTDVFEAYAPPKKNSQNMLSTEARPKPVIKKQVTAVPAIQPVLATLAPSAPPLPFRYIGKLLGDGEYVVFLGLQGKNLSVKMGETIQQTYRVDEIKPPAMQLTYLPMNIKQTMMIGEP